MQKDGKLFKKMGAQGQEARGQGGEGGKPQTETPEEDDTVFGSSDAPGCGGHRGIYL